MFTTLKGSAMAKPKANVKKNIGGRPTKYKESHNKDMIDFFDVDATYIDEVEGKLIPAKFPTLARFALNIGVHTDTLYEWAHGKYECGRLKHPTFSVTYKKAKLYQEAYLYENGLIGAIDKTFGIWATKVILGHKEPEKESQPIDGLADSISKLIDRLPN